ncbi:MAG: ABC transporter ATP-binding protein [Flavobacteriales bacterium CG11_big_fil_rev_8_21_14_0_20_35_7]|nr:MAG: ABC transporter ATP-binding protein [Flavobacteriales bacterium CG11_big_fil_rev_8_21_14_0_20_35_7]
MDEIAISFKNVSKAFKDHVVIDNLNFEVKTGKITTILGFSGAGKSTLLKLVLGLISPTSGVVQVLGRDLNSLSKVQLREFRRNFGMLFQYAALFDSLTAYENVAFPLKEFTALNKSQRDAKIQGLFESVGLDSKAAQKYPSELSGGMRKRVGLARALALNPAIILYDEPTTGLDPITTKMVNELIVSTANKTKGLTSLIISHDVRATLEISDYVAFLNRGKIVEYLSADEFRNSNNPLVQEFVNL